MPPAGMPSNYLWVADTGNDTVTSFKLDSTTGAPSNPTDTALIPAQPVPGAPVFQVLSLAVDPTSSILFMAGNTTQAVFPPRTLSAVEPATLSGGMLVQGQVMTGADGLSIGIVATANVVFAVTSSTGVTPGGSTPLGALSGFTYTFPAGALGAGTSVTQGTQGPPTSAVLNPSATFLYVVDPGDMTLQAYGVDTGGFVAGNIPAAVPTPFAANVVALDPQGVNLYTGNSNGTVSVFQVSASGAATLVIPSVSVEPTITLTPPDIQGIAIDPTGTWVVTANGPTGDVSLLRVNTKPSVALAVVGTPYTIPNAATPPVPTAVVFNGTGTVVYVANAGGNSISVLNLTSTGLTAVAGSPFALPAGDMTPSSLAVSQ